MTPIKHLTRQQINDDRWNHCIKKSGNGLLYAKTAYLDLLAGQWEALVAGDYNCIMPLVARRKYGVRYLYQPPFCQQLGIIGECSSALEKEFIEMAMSVYPFAEINMNFNNVHVQDSLCNNFIVDLRPDYKHISSAYSNDLKKNLVRGGQLSLQYGIAHNAEEPILHYRRNYGERFPQVREEHYNALAKFCQLYPEHCLAREVTSAGNLLATVLCLVDTKRIYFIASTTLPEGRNMEANHFLVDQLIKEHAQKPLVLDFEGSDIEGIASFYRNFGAVNQPYPRLRWNRLKWPWSMFKK